MQGLGKLLEPEVVIRVREVDKDLAKEAVEGAKSKFKEAFKGAQAPNISIDSQKYLPPPPSENNHDDEADSW